MNRIASNICLIGKYVSTNNRLRFDKSQRRIPVGLLFTIEL